MNPVNPRERNFWAWFRRGSGGKPGYKSLFDRSQSVHLLVGVLCGLLLPRPLDVAGSTVLLPLTAVLVGMTFAWAGSAQALLQADEVINVSKFVKGGFRQYVFTYQVAILALLVTTTAWGLAGLGAFEPLRFLHHPDIYELVKIVLYGLTSLSIRECWSVVLFAQAMLLMRMDLKNPNTHLSNNEAVDEATGTSVDMQQGGRRSTDNR